jgi:hypothetical protein
MNTFTDEHKVVTLPTRGLQVDLTAIAERYIERVRTAPAYEAYVALKCECGEGDVVLDRLASLVADGRELVALLEHSIFDHVSPRRIEETRVSVALSVIDFDDADFGVRAATAAEVIAAAEALEDAEHADLTDLDTATTDEVDVEVVPDVDRSPFSVEVAE